MENYKFLQFQNFGSFRVVSQFFLAGFGSFRQVSGRFGWFRVVLAVLGRFGSFRVLVSTIIQYMKPQLRSFLDFKLNFQEHFENMLNKVNKTIRLQ